MLEYFTTPVATNIPRVYFRVCPDTSLLMANGESYLGRLGTAKKNTNDWTYTTLQEKVKKVLSSYHTVVLTKEGNVWVTGSNVCGQLGLGDTTTRYSFTIVPLRRKVVDIAIGDWCTSVILDDGTLMTTGSPTDPSTFIHIPLPSIVTYVAHEKEDVLDIRVEGEEFILNFSS